jgi:hypothetical protein
MEKNNKCCIGILKWQLFWEKKMVKWQLLWDRGSIFHFSFYLYIFLNLCEKLNWARYSETEGVYEFEFGEYWQDSGQCFI